MISSEINSIKRNADLLKNILSSHGDDLMAISQELDQLLNSSRITYKSRRDYLENFPNGEDIGAKVKLILSRLK